MNVDDTRAVQAARRLAIVLLSLAASRVVVRELAYSTLVENAHLMSHRQSAVLCRVLYGRRCPHIIPGSWA